MSKKLFLGMFDLNDEHANNRVIENTDTYKKLLIHRKICRASKFNAKCNLCYWGSNRFALSLLLDIHENLVKRFGKQIVGEMFYWNNPLEE